MLKNFGKLFFVGEKPGAAQTMKLANNLLAACALAISSEAMVMGAKAGLDAQAMLDVINVSSGRNSATQDKFPKSVLPRTFDFGFATGLSYKDVCLLPRRGGIARRADDRRQRGAPAAGRDQRALRPGNRTSPPSARASSSGRRSRSAAEPRLTMAPIARPADRDGGSQDAFRGFLAGRRRQAEALPARLLRLRLRSTRPALEPAGRHTCRP